MKKTTLELLISAITILIPVEGRCASRGSAACGQPIVDPSGSRIVGGHEAHIGAWPWTVLLTEDDFAVCGGAIVSERVILTAAHCFENVISQNASRWKVVAGKHHLHKTDNGEMSFNVDKIIMHEHYSHNTVENDIAMLLVRETIPYTTFIRPICVPDGTANTAVSVGQACYLAGWGNTKGTGSQEVLNQVLVPAISDDVCSLPAWYYRDFIPIKTFCAGYEDGLKDACAGDSGGPLISYFNDRWYVTGVASWGYGCAEPRWPGIYTNVTYYLPWMQAKLTDNGLNMSCGQANSPVG